MQKYKQVNKQTDGLLEQVGILASLLRGAI